MKTLYLPIHILGTYAERSRANKHGLRDALAASGDVHELDYVALETPSAVDAALRAELDTFQPDVLLTQIQGTTLITASMLAAVRADYPQLPIINWNGDYWPEHLTAPEMLDVLRHTDLQLVVNGSVLADYSLAGIKADYCPFGYEAPTGDLPATKTHDVVFLGNNYSEKRRGLYDTLRLLSCDVGMYGSGWMWSDGECNYDFATAESLYRNATIAVSDNQFPDALGYLSDRPFQVMAAGGALLFQQRVYGLEAMTGLRAGVHYVEYTETDDLFALIPEWLSEAKANDRHWIVANAQAFVLREHTWAKRVEKLVNVWLPELGRVKA